MADDTSKQTSAKGPGTNPNIGSHSGGIDPTGPSAGTEQWGTTSDERRAVSTNDPEATRTGQMKGNPGDHMTAASQRASEAASTNKSRSEDTGYNQADLSRRTSASAYSMNTSHGRRDHTFRCADAGNADCRWETSGSTENEVMQSIVEHNRDAHGTTEWTEAMHDRVRNAIHRREAA